MSDIDTINATNSIDNIDNIVHRPLNCDWTLWIHLPHDTKWDIDSYKNIYKFNTVEDGIALIENMNEKLVINCMLFVMRNNILPLWEDQNNINGGSISYKINNKNVYTVWKKLLYALIGETLALTDDIQTKINGITISPKKNFCIIKIWLNSCEEKVQNPLNIKIIEDINNISTIFKKHLNA